MASNKGLSSRQKMINLMYLVFIAMLALNIPEEVLQGFDLVNDNLLQNIESIDSRNKQIYTELETSYKNNPEKAKEWYDKAQNVKVSTDSLFNYIQTLKEKIAKRSDGTSADVNDIKKKDNLDASSEIMLGPDSKQGIALKKAIDTYRNEILSVIIDEDKADIIKTGLSTEPSDRAKRKNLDWVHASFENMPSVAVITYFSQLQNNIKQAEGEAISYFLRNVDFKDFRVNDLTAFVIPESNVVIQGEQFKANIVLAAVDTTQKPTIFIDGKEQSSNLYTVGTSGSGLRTLKGYIELVSRDGQKIKRDFKQDYTVMEPMATIAPLLMDVVYAGINNPISISVPGVTNASVSARAEGGTLTKSGENWIARPVNIGQKFIITVSAGSRVVARKEFRIRALPDPVAYIDIADEKGNQKQFKRGNLSRTALLNTNSLKAAIDDGILNIPFSVISFSTMTVDAMGNMTIEMSAGANFSARQKDQFRRMERGKFFFISQIKVKGPDGLERNIAPMEIRLN